MGLDMYLYKKHYVKNWDHNTDRKFEIVVKLNGENHTVIDTSKISSIQEDVGYWRKANQIHDWFVKNCQNGEDNCQESYVDQSKLEELLQICKDIKANCKLVEGKVANGYTFDENGEKKYDYIDGLVMENEEYAADLLPTAEGFFFGSTGYDQYYLQDIDNTIEILEKELSTDWGIHTPEYYYRASW